MFGQRNARMPIAGTPPQRGTLFRGGMRLVALDKGALVCGGKIKIPRMGDFYFFADQNNDHSHPMPVQPNIQLARRTKIMSCLLLPVWRASHAGANTIAIKIIIAIAYFITSKISNGMVIYFYIPYFAASPNCSWILNNWLYFAMRSVRDIEPVLICPALVATARSAMVVSSVSPLRCEMTTP